MIQLKFDYCVVVVVHFTQMSELTGFKSGEYYVVIETTRKGRAQVALGRNDKVFDIPVPEFSHMYQPSPYQLGSGESVIVYNDKGKVVMQS